MVTDTETYLDGVMISQQINNSDGTGVEIHYDTDGNEIARIELDDLPIAISTHESIIITLDSMGPEAAAPIIHVLNALSELTEEQAMTVVNRLLSDI